MTRTLSEEAEEDLLQQLLAAQGDDAFGDEGGSSSSSSLSPLPTTLIVHHTPEELQTALKATGPLLRQLQKDRFAATEMGPWATAKRVLKLMGAIAGGISYSYVSAILFTNDPAVGALINWADIFLFGKVFFPIDGKATAYFCEDFVCHLPVHTPDTLMPLIRKRQQMPL